MLTFPHEVSIKVSEELYKRFIRHASLYELVLCEAAAAIFVQGLKKFPGSLSLNIWKEVQLFFMFNYGSLQKKKKSLTFVKLAGGQMGFHHQPPPPKKNKAFKVQF